MKQRTVAFVGNCQAQVLASIYRRRVGALLDEAVLGIGITPTSPDAELPGQLAALQKADVVVAQTFDTPERIPADFFAGRNVRCVRFPYIGGRYYWPYTGARHAFHQLRPDLPPPPYDDELGDSFLNQMIVENVPEEEALRRYDAAVAAGRSRILRLAELHLERQRDRDAACDMPFADFIAANYQRAALFTTQGHPALPLASKLVESVFLAIGVPFTLVDAAVRSLRVSPFPKGELPIHPGVGEALGLGFVTADRRYVFHHEGIFTFAEFARRYLAGAWEPDLARGINQAYGGQTAAAVPLLRAALGRCEGSAVAWRTLAMALDGLGEHAEAEAALQTAAVRDPSDPDTFGALAQMLTRRGDLAGAEAAARRAIELFPFGTAGHAALAGVLSKQRRFAEAVAVARVVLANDPGEPRSMTLLAHHLMWAGRPREAEALLRRALVLEPDMRAALRQLDEVTAQLAKRQTKPAQASADGADAGQAADAPSREGRRRRQTAAATSPPPRRC